MTDIAVRFDGVSKRYRLRRGWYFSIRDELAAVSRRLFSWNAKPRDEFWALRDVSFELKRGDTLGLIGPNGAGKSTLLKILSRVTVPTTGTFTAHGQVGALIEIGAGFHPDLTGRENVFLNGAIMGMRRAEIAAQFDRIVAFAQVERFIDTPIKYYSSGMTVRLGFAVAAHTDPEILLVDEVLAVGDAAFQAKCLNRLAELKEQDKTIILVSHTMPNIVQHSNRALWIDHGRIRAFGDPEPIVEAYLRSIQADPVLGATLSMFESSSILVRTVTVRDDQGCVADVLAYNRPATFEVAFDVLCHVPDPVMSVAFHDVRGRLLGAVTTRLTGVKLDTARKGGVARLMLTPVLFTRGVYTISVALYDNRIQRCFDLRTGAATFSVHGPGVSTREVSGHVIYPHAWEVEADAP